MKTSPKLLVLAFLAMACTARADLTLLQKVEVDGPQKMDMDLTTKIKGDLVRVDVNPQVSTIVNAKSGEVITLMHDQKMVMILPGDMMNKLKEQMKGKMHAEGETTKPVATGRKETISGYACEEYTFTSHGVKVAAWITKDVAGADKIRAQMEAFDDEADPLKGLLDEVKLEGLPIRTIMTSSEMGTTTVTLTGLNENPLSDTDFKAPSNYKSMQMPSIPGQ